MIKRAVLIMAAATKIAAQQNEAHCAEQSQNVGKNYSPYYYIFRNHYNAKDNKCYVILKKSNMRADTLGHTIGLKIRTRNYPDWVAVNAYENAILYTVKEDVKHNKCQLNGVAKACDEITKILSDLMEN